MAKIIKKTTVTTTVSETNKTLIVCILDQSFSMNTIIKEAISGFNGFLKDQKKEEGEAAMTVALFDDRYELLYNNVDIHKVKKIKQDEWCPRGMTALYDAIGKTINDVEGEIKKLKKSKRPDKIMVAIVTDGGENASKEFDHDDIKKLIKKKERDDWQFTFLAANQDAFSVGSSMGMSGGNTFSYTNTSSGNAVMFDKLSCGAKTFRSISKNDVNYASISTSLMSDENSGVSVNTTFTTTDTTVEDDNS